MDKFVVVEIAIVFFIYLIIFFNGAKAFFVDTYFGNILLIFVVVTLFATIIRKNNNSRYYSVVFLLIIFGEITYYNSKKEGFFYYNTNTKDLFTDNAENSVNSFRQKYCINNELNYKGKRVKNENAEHIFPEINYENRICNPCDVNCELKIIEQDKKSYEKELNVSTLV
jgi:hypothetical protein